MDRRLGSAQGLVVGNSFQVGYNIGKTMKYKKPSELDIVGSVSASVGWSEYKIVSKFLFNNFHAIF